MAFFVIKCSMIGSREAHFLSPSSVNKSVGLCGRRMGKNSAKRLRAKGKERRAKGQRAKGDRAKGAKLEALPALLHFAVCA